MVLFDTERLRVRRFDAGDAEYFFLLNSNEEAMRFIRKPKTREESDAFLQENLTFYQDTSVLGRYAVFEKLTGCFVGTFSFLYLSGDADFHIGYALLPAEWGKGYATELVKTGTCFFFDNTPHPGIFAITEAENIASQRVLLKAGFSRQAQIPEHGEMPELFVKYRA